VSLGPFSAGAVLGSIATLVAAGLPIYIRYVWGSKSHVSLTRFSTLEDSEWRDGRNESLPVWTRRCLIRATNSGWRDGVVTNVALDEVLLYGNDGTQFVQHPEDGIHKIELEHFAASGEMTRLDLRQRTNFRGQIVGGRDDGMMSIIPFILQESSLGRKMKSSNHGVFTFEFTIEDHKRIYYTTVDVQTSLEDSAGGKLQMEN